MLLEIETFDKYGYYTNELSTYSSKYVIVKCDFCEDVIEKQFSNYSLQRKKLNKDCCSKKECRSKKISEAKLSKNGVKKGYRRCSKCLIEKPLNSSNFNKTGKNDFRYDCKLCTKKIYHENKNLVTNKVISLEKSILIYDQSINEGTTLPYMFFERVQDLNGLMNYIFKVKTDEYINLFSGVNGDFINKYKLNYLRNKFKSIHGMISNFFPNTIKPWELNKAPQGIWKDDEQVKIALEWFIEQLYKDKIISKIEDFPYVCTTQLFERYNLIGLLSNRFDYHYFEAVNFIFPDTFKKYQFRVPNGYYNKKENRIEILNDFLDNLLKNNEIDNIEEIPSKVDINMFDKYNMKHFLTHVYQGVSWRAFDEIFPGKWKVWEFNSCPNGFWDDIENIHEASGWLLDRIFEDNLIEDIKQLPSIMSTQLFMNYNIGKLYNRREKVFKYFSGKFPTELRIDDFKLNIAMDGNKCLSKAEVKISNILLKNSIDYKYSTNVSYFINAKYNERYYPDWIINKNIIVEYFGLYVDNPRNFSILKNYYNKTKRKITFYNDLKDHQFIDLYPSDLQNNYEGLIKKFAEKGIEIKV